MNGALFLKLAQNIFRQHRLSYIFLDKTITLKNTTKIMHLLVHFLISFASTPRAVRLLPAAPYIFLLVSSSRMTSCQSLACPECHNKLIWKLGQ